MHRVQLERLQEKEKERRRKKKLRTVNSVHGLRPTAAASTTGIGGAGQSLAGGAQTAGLSKKNVHGQRVPMDASVSRDESTARSARSDSTQPLLLYFIWIGRSHTGYEWLIDMIREAESLDHATGKLHLQVRGRSHVRREIEHELGG
jgi:hypothetical protein